MALMPSLVSGIEPQHDLNPEIQPRNGIPGAWHVATRDMYIWNTHVPAGVVCTVYPYRVHRPPNLFGKSESVDKKTTPAACT